jgi:SAM-dependent methyltransferase
LNNKNDKAWEHYGKNDPYFGVLTADTFHLKKLDAEAKGRFFESGTRYVDGLMTALRDQLGPSFAPTRVLDFGCGVGRLTIPLSVRCAEAIGVDISDGMLAEAARNAEEQHRNNVSWVKGDAALSRVTGSFDLIHSFIVFQHIAQEQGLIILRRLISLLREGGAGSLQFTYANSRGIPRWRELATQSYHRLKIAYGVRNLAKGRPFFEPMMQMNLYDVNDILRILQETGCHKVSVRFTETNHFGFPVYGAAFMFQKVRLDVSEHGAMAPASENV